MLTGDLAKLGRIAADLDGLRDVPRLASEGAAERIEELIRQEFDAGVDPHGEAWAPLAPATVARGRHDPPLTDTRELRDSLLVYPSIAGGIRATLGTAEHPAGPHQDGWDGPQGSGPARPIFPSDGDMPIGWESAIQDAAIEAVSAKMAEVLR